MNLPSGVGRWRWLAVVAVVVAVGGGGIGYALTAGGNDAAGRPTPGGTAAAPRSGSPSPDAPRPQTPGAGSTAAGVPTTDAPSAAESGAHSSTPTADPSLFADAFDGSVTMKCTYDESGTTGIAYINGSQHIRVDYTNADKLDGHILKNGGVVYLWGAGLSQGVKLDQASGIDEIDQILESISPEKLASQTKDAACTKHSDDRSVFAVPASIEFIEPPAQR